MKLAEYVKQTFFQGPAIESQDENFEEYNLTLKSKDMLIPSGQEVLSIRDMAALRDTITLSVQLDEGEPIRLIWDNPDNFINDIENLFLLKGDDSTFILHVVVYKRNKDNMLSVYNLSEFINCLNSRTLKMLLFQFNKFLKNGSIIFHILDETRNLPIYTRSIIFTDNPAGWQPDTSYRDKLIRKRNDVCSYLNASEYDFIPEDFNLISNCANSYLKYIFDKLNILISLIYISNVSDIETDDALKYRIEGYKSFNFTINYSNMNTENLLSFYDAYEWVYTEGNLSDKIELARNIISLHLANRENVGLDNSAIEAIKSNYKIYLRENVEKYLEVKSKVIEFLFDMNQKVSESANSITKNFASNLLAILTFFVSVTIANSISDDRLQNIFTRDITIISFVILILSFIYLWYSIFEVNREKQRLKVVYGRLKTSYKEILAEEDLQNIFDNDRSFNEDMSSIDTKVKVYSRVWRWCLYLITLGIIFLAKDALSNELKFLINSLKK